MNFSTPKIDPPTPIVTVPPTILATPKVNPVPPLAVTPPASEVIVAGILYGVAGARSAEKRPLMVVRRVGRANIPAV